MDKNVVLVVDLDLSVHYTHKVPLSFGVLRPYRVNKTNVLLVRLRFELPFSDVTVCARLEAVIFIFFHNFKGHCATVNLV